MISGTNAGEGKRRIRLGMVGGGPGAFIGAVHRIAARMDDNYELVEAALSSDPARSRAAAQDLHIAPDRAYGSYAEMARAEAARPDRIDVVAIVTPNNLHYPMAKAFLEAGIHVICDKPLTTTVQEALDLAAIVKRTGLIFGLTHNYTGYPMVRQARQMIADGQLGKIRVVQVEYAQDWLATPLENTGQKQAAWRTDPAQSGPGGSSPAAHASRIPAGHPEGYLEAFAQLYTDLAEQIYARREGRSPSPASLLVPNVEDGVEGMRFIAATLESSKRNATWVDLRANAK